MEVPGGGSAAVDVDRMLIFDSTRTACEKYYKQNPLDADNLSQWGWALLELSQMGDYVEGQRMVKDAISKMEEALAINPAKHETLWAMGTAYTSNAIMTVDDEEAQVHFSLANQCFSEAVELNPGHEMYMKSLRMSSQMPEVRKQFQEKMRGQSQAVPMREFDATSKDSVENNNSDLKYDVFGWIILVVGIVAWVGMAKSQVPPPPLPPPS